MTISDPISDLLQACAELRLEATPSPELSGMTRAFVVEVASRGALPPNLLEALGQLPPHGAAWLAVSLGSAVENGLDPSLAGERLVQVFRAWLDRSTDGREPELMAALPTLSQAVVAHLARLTALRSSLANDKAFNAQLEQREPDSYAITWVRELIARRSGDLFVIHGPTQRVVHLQFRNVHRCFHLFSLIQSVLGSALPGGNIPNAAVAQAARGQSDDPVTDHAWWHYQRGGTKPSMNKALWGEESVDVLRGADGAHLAMLWEPILGDRKWNSGFFGPALEAAQPDMRFVAELEGDVASTWIARAEALT